MTYTLELIPRGTHEIVTQEMHHPVDVTRWTEGDASAVVKAMLRALERVVSPEQDGARPIALRGISWIVSPVDAGVVIALDIPSGQAVAGPFAIGRERLHDLLTLAVSRDARQGTVH